MLEEIATKTRYLVGSFHSAGFCLEAIKDGKYKEENGVDVLHRVQQDLTLENQRFLDQLPKLGKCHVIVIGGDTNDDPSICGKIHEVYRNAGLELAISTKPTQYHPFSDFKERNLDAIFIHGAAHTIIELPNEEIFALNSSDNPSDHRPVLSQIEPEIAKTKSLCLIA